MGCRSQWGDLWHSMGLQLWAVVLGQRVQKAEVQIKMMDGRAQWPRGDTQNVKQIQNRSWWVVY